MHAMRVLFYSWMHNIQLSPGSTRRSKKEHHMFISKIFGKESIQTLADQLGCVTGEAGALGAYGRPSVGGNTFGIKDQLKAAGARWNGQDKVWSFENWAALEQALLSILSK